MENQNTDRNLTENEKWDIIKNKVWAIEHIDEPTEEMCIYCVKNAWNTLKFIKNPSEKTILEAINSNGWAIQFVKNPSEEQKKLAVSNTYDAIKYISNPSLDIQLAAIKNNYRAINYIDNPSLKVKIAAIAQNPSAITSFKYTENEFELMLEHSLGILKYVVSYDKAAVIDSIKQQIAKEDVTSNFIKDFITIEALKLDKTKFIYDFGSTNAKKYYVDYNLDM